jgi:hypothetical protein
LKIVARHKILATGRRNFGMYHFENFHSFFIFSLFLTRKADYFSIIYTVSANQQQQQQQQQEQEEKKKTL